MALPGCEWDEKSTDVIYKKDKKGDYIQIDNDDVYYKKNDDGNYTKDKDGKYLFIYDNYYEINGKRTDDVDYYFLLYNNGRLLQTNSGKYVTHDKYKYIIDDKTKYKKDNKDIYIENINGEYIQNDNGEFVKDTRVKYKEIPKKCHIKPCNKYINFATCGLATHCKNNYHRDGTWEGCIDK